MLRRGQMTSPGTIPRLDMSVDHRPDKLIDWTAMSTQMQAWTKHEATEEYDRHDGWGSSNTSDITSCHWDIDVTPPTPRGNLPTAGRL